MGLNDIVTVNATSGGDTVSGSYYAGQILWDWVAPVPSGFEESIVSYCVDVLQDITDPQTVAISTTADPLMETAATNGGGKAAWLLNQFASTVTTGVQAAALQVAIWEAVADDSHNLDTGSFTLVHSDAAYTGAAQATLIYDQANYYLSQLFYGAQGQYNTSVARWLDATSATGGGQDQITTPEPSSLLLIALGGVVARMRGRRRPARISA